MSENKNRPAKKPKTKYDAMTENCGMICIFALFSILLIVLFWSFTAEVEIDVDVAGKGDIKFGIGTSNVVKITEAEGHIKIKAPAYMFLKLFESVQSPADIMNSDFQKL